MSKLDSYKREIINFFESYLHIYSKDKNTYTTYRSNPDAAVRVAIPDEDGVSKNYYRVEYLGHVLLIKATALKVFCTTLDTMDPARCQQLRDFIISPRKTEMKLLPIIPYEMLQNAIENPSDEVKAKDEAYWGEVVGANFATLDQRFDGLHKSIEREFEHISRLMAHSAPLFAADGSKVKVDDTYFFFNSKGAGREFEIFLSPTLVPAVHDKANIEPNRSEMTADEYEKYFGYPTTNKEKALNGITIADEILASLERVKDNTLALYKNELVEKYPACLDYIETKINTILIPVIVTVRLECYSEFGGKLSIAMLEEGTQPNAIACGEIIDKAVTEIQEHLKSIPIPEGSGVDHYSIEVDSMGIYGRDASNVVVQAMVEPHFMYDTKFGPRFSDGFQRILKDYIKTIKNDAFFSQIGEVTEKPVEEVASQTVASDEDWTPTINLSDFKYVPVEEDEMIDPEVKASVEQLVGLWMTFPVTDKVMAGLKEAGLEPDTEELNEALRVYYSSVALSSLRTQRIVKDENGKFVANTGIEANTQQ